MGINTDAVPLTTGVDIFTGTSGSDTFVGTYNDAGTGTWNVSDVLDGGAGIDTLNITPIGVAAITPADAYWTNITNIEKIVINTTGAGAQTITTGTAFQAAFAANGVDMTTASTAGAINIDMQTGAFSGAAIIRATSTAGVQTILTGTGVASVTSTSTAGAINITSANLAAVTATSTDGVQTIVTGADSATTVTATSIAGDQNITGANLARVDATTTGAGVQAIVSTGASDVIVNATSDLGATTITTGVGNDTITLFASAAAGANTITAAAGADTITLYSNFSSVDTINQADGDSFVSTGNTTDSSIGVGETITFADGVDIINGFNATVDTLNVGTAGAAVSGIGRSDAALAGAAGTVYFSGAYDAAAGVFTIAANGAGADTLVLDATVGGGGGDRNVTTADTWVVLVGVDSADLVAGSFT